MISRAVSFPATDIAGHCVPQTGLVQIPPGRPPAGGWPFVTYGHMTTGGCDWAAPSQGTPAHPEWRRMSQGDALCKALVANGVVVLRPDYEGIGSPGVHPYLIGDSLASSVIAMVRARHDLVDGIGDRWVSAGHSEGAVAALFAAQADRARPDDANLLGVSAFAPVTRMDLTIAAATRIPVRTVGTGVVSALVGLMLQGAATVDEDLAALLPGQGLSPAAQAVWGDLDRLGRTELARRDSWGGIAPGRIADRRLLAHLWAVFRANDVRDLQLAPVPVRIDAALFDEVAPAELTRRLMHTYRGRGVDLTTGWWPTHHSGTMQPRHAPAPAAQWILARLAHGQALAG